MEVYVKIEDKKHGSKQVTITLENRNDIYHSSCKHISSKKSMKKMDMEIEPSILCIN